jgi:hypothetical protein
LAEGGCAGRVIVEHENVNLPRLRDLGRARHFRSIAPGEAEECEKA